MNKNLNQGKIIFVGLFVMLALVSSSFAQETAQEAAPAAPAMSEEMMAKFKEYSTPNDNHKALEGIVGSWETSLKWWMSPAGPAEESTGTAENVWIFDGRFLYQSYSGTSMGQPFEGRGYTGYDNAKKEYVSIWLDNMGTGIMSVVGSFDAATKTLTESGEFMCPIKGKMPVRWVTKIIDENSYSFETYTNDESGNEFRNMEIVYKRKS